MATTTTTPILDLLGPQSEPTQYLGVPTSPPSPPSPPQEDFDPEPQHDFQEDSSSYRPKRILTKEQEEKKNKIIAALESCKWDPNKEYPKPRAVFSLNGHVWATPGNISAFSAMSKAGKSSLTGGILSSILPGDGDCFGFTASNPLGWAVVHIDTEQSGYHHAKKMGQVLQRKSIDTKGCPSWLLSYKLAGKTLDMDWLITILEAAEVKFGGVHSVVLDGSVDFVVDPNNAEHAFGVVRQLMEIAEDFNTHILCIIHINPSSTEGKTRGHFGSELERRAETNLTINLTTTSRTVYSRSARDCSIPESAGTRFMWNEDAHMFMSATEDDKADLDGFNGLDILELLLTGPMAKACILKTLKANAKISQATFYRKYTELEKSKFISISGTSQRGSKAVLTDLGFKQLLHNGRATDGETYVKE